MAALSRRIFLKVGSSAAVTPAVVVHGSSAAQGRATPPPMQGAAANGAPYLFFSASEAAIMEAAVDRLIPPDELGPSAQEAGVVNYIDRQLAGAWGAGDRLYRSGPWKAGTPSQGYQLPFTPAEMFRNALRALLQEGDRNGTAFAKLPGAQQDARLTRLQNGGETLEGVPSKVFFETLLGMTIEGYFSDPAYGGNRGMAAWSMIGFPGAYGNYYELVDQHGIAFNVPPRSLAEDGHGHVHELPVAAPPTHRPQGRR